MHVENQTSNKKRKTFFKGYIIQLLFKGEEGNKKIKTEDPLSHLLLRCLLMCTWDA